MPASTYCRLFNPDPHPLGDTSVLARLGLAMSREAAPLPGWDDTRIPAGYTYFGQFIAHDLSFDASKGPIEGMAEPTDIPNARTMGLALASVYGEGPAGRDRRLFEEDGVRLRLQPLTAAGASAGCDLPRSEDGRAIIADERNDETVAIAQLLVCIMAFHNKVADHLDAGLTGKRASFQDVRRTVDQHVQSAVLHDFLWRLVPDDVYFDVLRNGRRLFHAHGVPRGTPLTLPAEFAHAAFRFGHSMVRASYRWNRTITFATLANMLKNTHRNGGTGFLRLHPDWAIDWRNFLDFSGLPGIAARKRINFARKIDTQLTDVLAQLPAGERAYGEPASLAVRDLLRGRALRLPPGQQAARECYRRHGVYLGELGPGDFTRIRDPQVRQILQDEGLDARTPLWVYILAEAELEEAGERLGRLGGRIVMEVLHALIEASEYSILATAGWRSTLPAQRADVFTLSDLVAFSGIVPGTKPIAA